MILSETTNSVSREVYNKLELLNQSFIKKIMNDPQFTTEDHHSLYFEEKEYFVFGNLVDFILTSNEDLEELYYVTELDVQDLNINYKSIAHYVYDKCYELNDFSLETRNEFIVEGFLYHKYQINYLVPTKIKKFDEEIGNYFEILKYSNNKQIISKTLYQKALDIKDMLLNSVFNTYFNFKGYNETLKEYNYYQVFLENEICNVGFKGLLDHVKIKVVKNTIFARVVDLKTTSCSYQKLKSEFYTRGYDIQACVYQELLRKELEKKLLPNQNLVMEEPLFIFVHSSGKFPPVGIQVSQESLIDTMEGRINGRHKAPRWKGLSTIIEEYEKYYSINGFSIPFDFKDNNTITI